MLRKYLPTMSMFPQTFLLQTFWKSSSNHRLGNNNIQENNVSWFSHFWKMTWTVKKVQRTKSSRKKRLLYVGNLQSVTKHPRTPLSMLFGKRCAQNVACQRPRVGGWVGGEGVTTLNSILKCAVMYIVYHCPKAFCH